MNDSPTREVHGLADPQADRRAVEAAAENPVPPDEDEAADHGDELTKRSMWYRTASVAYDMLRDFIDNRGTGLAAEVTFFAILAIFPALLVIAALLGFLSPDLSNQAQAEVHDFLTNILSESAAGIVDSILGLFNAQSTSLLTFATLAALYSVSRSFQALIRALNLTYDLKDPRGWLTTRAIGLVMALGTVLLVFMVLVGIVILPTISSRITLFGHSVTIKWLTALVVFVVAVGWIMTIYHFAPYHRTRWRADVWGAVLCAVLWIVFSLGFRLYLFVTADTNQILTALGGGLVALLWMYLMAIAIMLGGELNSVLWRHGIAVASSQSGDRTFLTRPHRDEVAGYGTIHPLPSRAELEEKWHDLLDRLPWRKARADTDGTTDDREDAVP